MNRQGELIEKERLEDSQRLMVAWGPGQPGTVTAFDTPKHNADAVRTQSMNNERWKKASGSRVY